jgi:hypothetical protein
MRNTNFLIMEASMQDEELIIGLPELKKMGLDPVRIIDEVRANFHVTDFSDCGPTAVFEKPAKMGRMMLLRHANPVTQDAECGSLRDEKDIHDIIKCQKFDTSMISGRSYDWADTSDQDSLPSLCSDSDPEDMNQQDADDLELSLVYGVIEDDDPIPQDDTEVGNTDDEELEETLLALADNDMIKGASNEFVTELREILVT